MSSTEQASRSGSRDEWLSFVVGAVTVVAVLAIGAVHPSTQVVLSSLTALALAGFVILRGKRGLRPVPFAGVAGLALVATALQLVPLPSGLVALLSPQAYELRNAVTPDARFMPLTLDVPATWLALARGAACLGLLVLTDGLTRSRRDARRFLWLLALVGAGLAAIAFTQRLVGAKQILGLYTPRGTPGWGFFGTFVDVNHCASVLALGTLVAAGLAVERQGRKRGVLVLCAVLAGSALLFTGSRGGLAGFAVGGVALILILMARVTGVLRAALAALVILLIGASLTLWAHEGLRARTVAAPAQLWSNQKVRGWSDGIRMANAYRWTGVGRGAFEAPVNAYRSDDEGVRLVYPENLLVQLTSEWGFPVALALLVLAFVRATRLAPAIVKLPAGSVGAACAVLAVLTHELFDFGLEMPGVAFPTVLALGVVTGGLAVEERRTTRARGPRLSPRVTLPLVAAWALALVAAAWSCGHTLDRDWERVRADASTTVEGNAVGPGASALEAAMARHPADDYLPLLAAQRALRDGRPEAMRHLNRALTLHPSNWQAHHLAARVLAAWKRPAQAALEYRLARESGMPLDVNELVRVLGAHVVEAAPQTPQSLLDLARALYSIGHFLEADAAAARAVDLAESSQPSTSPSAQGRLESSQPSTSPSAQGRLESSQPSTSPLAQGRLESSQPSTSPLAQGRLDAREPVLVLRVQLALDASRPAQEVSAGKALLAEAEAPESFVLAARALAAAGDRAAANAAIEAGLKSHPHEGLLYLSGARLRFEAADYAGARGLLARAGKVASLSLEDRLHAEELLADVADKTGDTATAMLARARSRMIAQRIRDMSFSHDKP